MTRAADVVYLQNEQQAALDAARHLAAHGVPIFIAQPALDHNSNWVPDGGTSHTGYTFPNGWQRSRPDPRVIDRWRIGDALCAVMGHVVDGADFDPQHGGAQSEEHLKQQGALPRIYGTQATPSGGWHHLVASLSTRSRDGVLPGFDYKAGTSGGGHGFLFLAPTLKLSKTTGEPNHYSWVTPPNLDDPALDLGLDLSGQKLRDLLQTRTATTYDGPTYIGRRYAELSPAERAWADADVLATTEWWRDLLQEASSWPDNQRDNSGRGWEALVRDWTWVCARLAVTPWIGLDTDAAEELCATTIPQPLLEAVGSKWDQDLMQRASTKPVEPPPWDGLGTLRDQERVDVTNPAVAAEWLRNEIGMSGTPLAGLFRRNEEVVHTPRIDEDGYVALSRADRDVDGPAQIRPAGPDKVASRIQFSYSVVKRIASRQTVEGCLFPFEAVRVVLGDTHLAPNLRPLRGVTHTPMLRQDGSVLDTVGYDDPSHRLFLPDAGLAIPEIPLTPTPTQVTQARDLILTMIQDFPFNTVHDRANYILLLLTPLLRELVPPPYKMGVLNAHQPGSGKSLLAWIPRTIHGGVLRGDVPKDSEEFRKQITSILTTTTAPIIQFDNVRHLEASVLDAVLTSDTWSDRVLGSTKEATARNDRLWLATGNNVTLGGDLVRRVLWVSIDPRLPHPEARTDFAIPDLKAWVRARRGELLAALLTILRAWVVAGRPTGPRVGSDDFAPWIEAARGIFQVAGIPGIVEDQVTVQQKTTEEGDDMVSFFQTILEAQGTEKWSAGDITDLVFDEVPDGLNVTSSRSLGRWLTKYQGRWAGDLCVRQDGNDAHGRAKMWRIERYSAPPHDGV